MDKTSKQVQISPKSENKTKKLVMGLFFDVVGMLSYLVPFFGEFADVVWAPIAGILLMKMYNGNVGKVGGVIVFIEELLPGIDVVPTFTLTWIYTYYIKKEK